MPNEGQPPQAALERSLVRMQAALATATQGWANVSPAAPAARARTWGAVFLGLSAASLGLFAAVGGWPLLVPVVGFGVGGALAFGRGWIQRQLAQSGGPAHIGMGASISSSAVVEPGAIVEMGATVRSGALIRSGALLGMGSTVGANAVVERGAVVSWGVTVRAGAHVGANAVVGWGATVGKGVHVPPGMRLRAGATVTSGWLREHLPGLPANLPPSQARDSVQERALAACDRLQSELRASPEQVRSFLGTSEGTVASLRQACEDLLRREQAVRNELEPTAVGRLEAERKELEERRADATDERIRESLSGAVAALDDQRRQHELLRLSADRLQAERMRLVYTLEGVAAQFVRLRTAGAEAGRASTAALEQGVRDLGTELDAIADALEEESQDTSAGPKRVRG